MLSKKIQGKVKSVKGLVDYCDVVAFRSYPHPVDVSIRMKSDGVVFHGEPCLLVFHCLVRCYKVEKKGRHFFYEKAEHVLELPLLKSCDELEFLSYDDETFTEIIKRVDARKSITIDCYQLKEPNWSWMENEKVTSFLFLTVQENLFWLFVLENCKQCCDSVDNSITSGDITK